MPVAVREGSIDELDQVYRRIPEFVDGDVDVAELDRRLGRESALVLVAELDGELIGFKAGYDRYQDGSWYSWLGGVVPEHRSQGAAFALMQAQEAWVADHGYQRIYVKTRNRFVAMRILLARNGYQVADVDASEGLDEARILHVKALVPG